MQENYRRINEISWQIHPQKSKKYSIFQSHLARVKFWWNCFETNDNGKVWSNFCRGYKNFISNSNKNSHSTQKPKTSIYLVFWILRRITENFSMPNIDDIALKNLSKDLKSLKNLKKLTLDFSGYEMWIIRENLKFLKSRAEEINSQLKEINYDINKRIENVHPSRGYEIM